MMPSFACDSTGPFRRAIGAPASLSSFSIHFSAYKHVLTPVRLEAYTMALKARLELARRSEHISNAGLERS